MRWYRNHSRCIKIWTYLRRIRYHYLLVSRSSVLGYWDKRVAIIFKLKSTTEKLFIHNTRHTQLGNRHTGTRFSCITLINWYWQYPSEAFPLACRTEQKKMKNACGGGRGNPTAPKWRASYSTVLANTITRTLTCNCNVIIGKYLHLKNNIYRLILNITSLLNIQ